MSRQFLKGCLFLCAVSLSAFGEDKAEQPAAGPTNPGLEKMKTLVGTWVAADEDGKPTDQVVSVIKLTSGGSAVHETIFPGEPHGLRNIGDTPARYLVFEFHGPRPV